MHLIIYKLLLSAKKSTAAATKIPSKHFATTQKFTLMKICRRSYARLFQLNVLTKNLIYCNYCCCCAVTTLRGAIFWQRQQQQQQQRRQQQKASITTANLTTSGPFANILRQPIQKYFPNQLFRQQHTHTHQLQSDSCSNNSNNNQNTVSNGHSAILYAQHENRRNDDSGCRVGDIGANLAQKFAAAAIAKTTTTTTATTVKIVEKPQTEMAAEQRLENLKCASYVDVASVSGYANTAHAPQLQDEAENSVVDAAGSEVKPAINTACLPSLYTFTVQLDFALEPHELVGLTGETKALGEWRLENCIELQQEVGAPGNNIWSANVMLPCQMGPIAGLSYRYFIYTKNALGYKHIRRWETHLQPRRLQTHELNEVETQMPDRFGIIDGSKDDAQKTQNTNVNRGWLTTETIVQFKFERERMFRVRDINKFDAEHVQIKVEPLVQRSDQFVEVHVDVAKLNYGESHLQKQPPHGAAYRRGDVLIFHLTVLDVQSNGYHLTFYTPAGELVGSTAIEPQMLVGSEGELHLDIREPTQAAIVAHLTLPYVVVRPYANAKLLDFRTTYAHYWPKSWPKLDVGHRGNGKSFIHDPPAERENTLASFMRAYESHADMIELDVHLTADGVPIIYHDFGVHTAPLGKQVNRREQLEYVLIKDMDYESIKNLRVFAVIKGDIVEYPAHNSEPRFDHRIFPRLYDVLANLPKSLGIDVEIKWPQRTACGGVEALQTIDKNFFVDRVLDTIIQHGCGRPLIFSSFDADICTMLRFKQNIFPVMFLTQGETKKWSPFMDLRTRNFVQAINNAQAFELAGTAPHAEDFLGEHGPALMQKAVEAGQIAVVWGDDLNSHERIKYFTTIGATAICYDRADLFVPEHKERAFFNSSDLLAEFEAQCPATY